MQVYSVYFLQLYYNASKPVIPRYTGSLSMPCELPYGARQACTCSDRCQGAAERRARDVHQVAQAPAAEETQVDYQRAARCQAVQHHRAAPAPRIRTTLQQHCLMAWVLEVRDWRYARKQQAAWGCEAS